jgi:F420-dependent oxidoreductase-like protein
MQAADPGSVAPQYETSEGANVKVGLQLPLFDFGQPEVIGPTLRKISRVAEEAGFSSLWVMDHFFQLDPFIGSADQYMLEAYTTLGHLAAATERIRVGALVGGVIYRSPGLLVKSVTTLDVLSGGRTYFGIGAGWYEREAAGLGFPFPSTAERFEWLEDTLQVAEQMWSTDDGPFVGEHFELDETICEPQPVSQPHPPVMIGGNGERKTLRLVAEYGDACNLLNLRPEGIKAKLAVLRDHCDRLERDYEEIERTSLSSAGRGDPADLVDDTLDLLEGQANAGIQHAIVNLPNAEELGVLEIFGEEIIPKTADF